jgi:hypothetical protein
MASLKLHVYRGENPGTESCDFRGENFVGAEQGDHHRTILEIDPATEGMVALALEQGVAMNAVFEMFKSQQPDFAGNVATALGLEGDGLVGLRFGVWDE